jgi:glycosyltransferase involved in cell wall biosynthesis
MVLKNNRDIGCEPDFRIVEPGEALSPAEMVEFYNQGRALLIASSSEGTPNIALEAAACGCTIITTPVGNMPELIHDGRNGFFIWAKNNRQTLLLEFLTALRCTRQQWKLSAESMQPIIREWDWSLRSRWFYAVFNAVYEKKTIKPFTYLRTPPERVGR